MDKWYRDDPKFSDRYAWANSADLDQTAPDQGLHCFLFRLHRLDTSLEWLEQIFWVSEYLGNLR